MSPTRRQFLYAFGAGGAMVYATLLPMQDSDLRAVGLDTDERGYLRQPIDMRRIFQPPAALALVDAHGLPPATRMEVVRCLECGNPLGQLLVDEMQSFNGFNGYACGDCFKDKVDEIEDMSSEADLQDKIDEAVQEAREDMEVGLEEARTESREARAKLKLVEGIAERLRWQLVDLRTAPLPSVRQIERMEEALDAFIKGT